MSFHTKFGPDRFSRFNVYWIQTTDRQTDKLNLYIDVKAILNLSKKPLNIWKFGKIYICEVATSKNIYLGGCNSENVYWGKF